MCMLLAWIKIAIKRELGLLRSSLLNHSYASNSISKATPPCSDKPTSACSTLMGMKPIPDINEQSSKGHLSGKLRPLSLPKPTIILPFSHSKTMTILKDGHMKPVTLLLPTCMVMIIMVTQYKIPPPPPQLSQT